MEPQHDRADVVIVGAGHGGAQCAIALRQAGFDGSIALIGAEPDPPYERPPLSKEYLAGDRPFERLLIRPRSFWAERGIVLWTDTTVTGVNPADRTLSFANGGGMAYGTLVWAAGGTARRLACPGGDLDGVHRIRHRGDVDRLVAQLPTIRCVVVIGGGYIGLEAAAQLVKLGRQVTVIEAQDRLLSRVAGTALADFLAREHRAQGVTLHLSASVSAIEGEGAVRAVRLGDGGSIAADAVIAGIGIDPSVAPLAAAGAAVDDGVLVDRGCATSLPNILAIGDCARHPNRHAATATIRLESVQNAHDQARVAAARILGQLASYDMVPWFWSNQYDLKLQTVGIAAGHDDAIVRGDPVTRAFSVIYRRAGRVVAIDCVNRTRDYVAGRALVERGAAIDRNLLADPDVPLKQFALDNG